MHTNDTATPSATTPDRRAWTENHRHASQISTPRSRACPLPVRHLWARSHGAAGGGERIKVRRRRAAPGAGNQAKRPAHRARRARSGARVTQTIGTTPSGRGPLRGQRAAHRPERGRANSAESWTRSRRPHPTARARHGPDPRRRASPPVPDAPTVTCKPLQYTLDRGLGVGRHAVWKRRLALAPVRRLEVAPPTVV